MKRHLAFAGAVLLGAISLATGAAAAQKRPSKINAYARAATPIPLGVAATPTTPPISGKATSRIKVRRAVRLADVNVGVRLNVDQPTFDTDQISLYLSGPSGATALLYSGHGNTPGIGLGSGPASCKSGTTTFDDEAKRFIYAPAPPNPLTDNPSFAEFRAHPPYTGRVQSDGANLDIFEGLRSKGRWRLILINSSTNETATLLCWTLRLAPSESR